MGYKVQHRRIKEKYSPTMNAREKRHKAYVKEQPCFGCGAKPVDAHHTMLHIEGKRWRRDHAWILPACKRCHQGPAGIHGIGSEMAWLESIGQTQQAAETYMAWLWEKSE